MTLIGVAKPRRDLGQGEQRVLQEVASQGAAPPVRVFTGTHAEEAPKLVRQVHRVYASMFGQGRDAQRRGRCVIDASAYFHEPP